jgi:hypothetical protein
MARRPADTDAPPTAEELEQRRQEARDAARAAVTAERSGAGLADVKVADTQPKS